MVSFLFLGHQLFIWHLYLGFRLNVGFKIKKKQQQLIYVQGAIKKEKRASHEMNSF